MIIMIIISIDLAESVLSCRERNQVNSEIILRRGKVSFADENFITARNTGSIIRVDLTEKIGAVTHTRK